MVFTRLWGQREIYKHINTVYFSVKFTSFVAEEEFSQGHNLKPLLRLISRNRRLSKVGYLMGEEPL